MITIKQPLGSKVCGAACVAMLTGETLEQVLDRVTLSQKYGHLSIREVARALLEKDLLYGTHVVFLAEQIHKSELKRDIDLGLLHMPAIVCVHSDTYIGYYHLIVYDPDIQMFRDPSPAVGDKCNWDRYRFVDWTPIIKIEEQYGD